MAANIIFNILLWVAGIAGFVSILGIIPLSTVGTIFYLNSAKEKNLKKAK